MSHFNYELANTLANVAQQVKIECIVSDSNITELEMTPYFHVRQTGKKEDLRRLFNECIASIRSNHSKIDVEFVNAFVPISYFAIDYSSQIDILKAKATETRSKRLPPLPDNVHA